MRAGTFVIGTQPIGSAGAVPTTAEQATTAFVSVATYGGVDVQYFGADEAAVEASSFGGAAIEVPAIVLPAYVTAFGQDTEIPVVTTHYAETAYVVSKGRLNFPAQLFVASAASAAAAGQIAASIECSQHETAIVAGLGQDSVSAKRIFAEAGSVAAFGQDGASVKVATVGIVTSLTAQVHATVELMLASLATTEIADGSVQAVHAYGAEAAYIELADISHLAAEVSVVYPAFVSCVGLPGRVSGRDAAGNVVVMNTHTFAVSTYSTPTLGAVESGNVLYLLGEDGLLAPDPTGDAVVGILETGMLSLGVDGPKRMPSAVLHMSASTDVELVQSVEMYGRQDAEYSYRVIGVPANGISRHVQPLGRGVQADYVAFRISGFDHLNGIEIEATPSLVNR